MSVSNPLPNDRPDSHYELELFQASVKMKEAGLPGEFIATTIHMAFNYGRIADLVMMWVKETSSQDREEIVADIQEMIDACSQKIKIQYEKIHFNDLPAVANDIRHFKDSLLAVVMNHGGITALSEKTGIPQPSLSRFFNSNAMPRRNTLLKIGRALGLSAIDIEKNGVR